MLTKFIKNLSEKKTIDFNSLRFRLTLGVALLSTCGLGSVALWMNWKMQHLLIMTHKETVNYVENRFPHDVEIYSEMVSLEVGIQKTINNLSDHKNIFWFKNKDNNIIAQSVYFYPQLAKLNYLDYSPQFILIDKNSWLICGIPLNINQQFIGHLYIAQNITNEQVLFTYLIQSLTISTTIAITIMITLIAYYISYSLKPLEKICNVAENISADKLKEVSINFNNSPSEVKKLAQTLEKMLMRLGENWENQQQLLNNVSHELRTPLTIVSGYLQSTLRRGENLTSIQKEALSVAVSEANRTIQLLEDLLDLARADNGNIQMQLEIVIVNDLMREIIAMTQQYHKRNINLREENSNLKIKVDRNRFKQICLNLIDNAIKYSPENTDIKIVLKQDKSVIIEIHDQGIGIPFTLQNRIFERFYRVEEARNRDTGGTGLGLAIVKSLVTTMNGKVTLVSPSEKGCIFTLSFPLIE
ncbi:MAG: HAMP domain-containing histidine kinase [Cyanobacteria bacterium]|nr:HAMP domain-containing histidine kinase [Cyanobacteria bacterium CG_2015-16_32_12]NCO77657.1 HAMP domain-containing histidine kinase [Cyanobacteria bacterium CG_2015-22_32_23]NCQ04111.1 HAMP domain-containing histidine kinase [Cyanobacteria bacterium CG_2015-09_32_10]NCQ41490.1 HAMP domain-containing histidine kinase [Cyanobacteria bacterium CG_2015-04_32_10]NCS85926.1 HAMP domain-containing histidine kinase [Cyanobacteria bacterium CG_2015-02_32_10]